VDFEVGKPVSEEGDGGVVFPGEFEEGLLKFFVALFFRQGRWRSESSILRKVGKEVFEFV